MSVLSTVQMIKNTLSGNVSACSGKMKGVEAATSNHTLGKRWYVEVWRFNRDAADTHS